MRDLDYRAGINSICWILYIYAVYDAQNRHQVQVCAHSPTNITIITKPIESHRRGVAGYIIEGSSYFAPMRGEIYPRLFRLALADAIFVCYL